MARETNREETHANGGRRETNQTIERPPNFKAANVGVKLVEISEISKSSASAMLASSRRFVPPPLSTSLQLQFQYPLPLAFFSLPQSSSSVSATFSFRSLSSSFSSSSSSSFSTFFSSSSSSFSSSPSRFFHSSSFPLGRADDDDSVSDGDHDVGGGRRRKRRKNPAEDEDGRATRTISQLSKEEKLRIFSKGKQRAQIINVDAEDETKSAKRATTNDNQGIAEANKIAQVQTKIPLPRTPPAATPRPTTPASPSSKPTQITNRDKGGPSTGPPSSSSPPPAAAVVVVLNEKIQSPSLMILDADGKRLGVFSRSEGLKLAREKKLDLLLVSPPHVVPAVCKMLDYAAFKYQQSLRERAAAKLNKVREVKTVQVSAVIDPHDLSVKLNQARDFLLKGHPVKVMYKARRKDLNDENAHLVYVPLFEKVKNGLIGVGDCGDIQSKPYALFTPVKSKEGQKQQQ